MPRPRTAVYTVSVSAVVGITVGQGLGALAGSFASALAAIGSMSVLLAERRPDIRAWPQRLTRRAWLAQHHLLPLRLNAFLTDACRRGVLKQTGAAYQFCHIQLRHRLADRVSAAPATTTR